MRGMPSDEAAASLGAAGATCAEAGTSTGGSAKSEVRAFGDPTLWSVDGLPWSPMTHGTTAQRMWPSDVVAAFGSSAYSADR